MFKKLGGALANAAKQQVQQAIQQQQQQHQPAPQQPQQYQQPQQQWTPQPPPQVTPPAPQAPQGFPNPGEIWAFADPSFRGACSRFSVGDIPNLVVTPVKEKNCDPLLIHFQTLGINDNISSIRCGPNTYVDMFEHSNFQYVSLFFFTPSHSRFLTRSPIRGQKVTFFGDQPGLGQFDNRASSLRIYTQDPLPTGAPPSGEAWLYSELNFGGTILRAVGDCPDLNV